MRKWTEEQEEAIRQLYPKIGLKKLSEKMGIPLRTLWDKAQSLGVVFRTFEWTRAALAVVKERYRTDGPKKLAKKLGTTNWAVTAKARRLGIEPNRRNPKFKWTKSMFAALKDRYVKEGGEKLSREFGIAIDTLRRKASGLGLHTIAGHAVAGCIRAEKNSKCNLAYFDAWTPNMAYILGFLFADGSVNKNLGSIRVAMASKDEAVLKFMRREIAPEIKIYHREGWIDARGSVCQPQSILIISSTILVSKAMALGLKPRKTFNDDPFPDVPDEMMPHFVRGYLDGDGSVSVSSKGVCSVQFVGSPRFIAGVRDSLVRLVKMRTPMIQSRGNKTKWATITWYSLEDLRLFHDFVYGQGGFCLNRKKDKLVKWLSEPRGHYYPRKNVSPNQRSSNQCLRH